MPEVGDEPGSESPRPPGPEARPLPCATCKTPVDPLRAARVAFIGERFRYFCSADCRARFDPSSLTTPMPRPRRRGPADPALVLHEREADASFLAARRTAEALAGVAADGSDELALAAPREEPAHEDAALAPADAPDVATLLLGLAMLGGTLAVALALAGSSATALTARSVVVVVACAALVAEYVMGRRDPVESHPAELLAGPVLATLTALAALVLASPKAPAAISLAGLVVAVTAIVIWLVARARRPLDAEREVILSALQQPAHRVVGEDMAPARALDLRPGEEIVIEPGESVPADVTVVAGSAVVYPWLGARTTATRAEGDSIVAGATVERGRLRAVVAWAGHDRAWMRLTHDPRRRADLLAPLARAGRLTAGRLAPIAAGLGALTAFAANYDPVTIAMFAVAAQAAIANAAVAQIGALHVSRSVLDSLARGIAFRTADTLDGAGRVSVTAFCARGTLLLGEPEVANVEPFGAHDAQQVLALVAGVESGATHPTATAVLRAARARGIRPDGVRSPTVQPGLGVTAVASNGEPLVVGSRAHMLRERISVAAAEQKITELEAMGRTVLLVALRGRLLGVVGLQDGLRPGARAAVQHLLDAGVEPVLLSGDSRETCEALGRALDIEHVRPDLLPTERGDEVRRLADGGAVVAVIGRSPNDDLSLSAADVAVALGAAGSAEWSIQLASDDVRDAAYAIFLAHRCRSDARAGLALALAPAVAGAIAVAFALVPPPIAPLAALAGALLALFRLRGSAQTGT